MAARCAAAVSPAVPLTAFTGTPTSKRQVDTRLRSLSAPAALAISASPAIAADGENQKGSSKAVGSKRGPGRLPARSAVRITPASPPGGTHQRSGTFAASARDPRRRGPPSGCASSSGHLDPHRKPTKSGSALTRGLNGVARGRSGLPNVKASVCMSTAAHSGVVPVRGRAGFLRIGAALQQKLQLDVVMAVDAIREHQRRGAVGSIRFKSALASGSALRAADNAPLTRGAHERRPVPLRQNQSGQLHDTPSSSARLLRPLAAHVDTARGRADRASRIRAPASETGLEAPRRPDPRRQRPICQRRGAQDAAPSALTSAPCLISTETASAFAAVRAACIRSV